MDADGDLEIELAHVGSCIIRSRNDEINDNNNDYNDVDDSDNSDHISNSDNTWREWESL